MLQVIKAKPNPAGKDRSPGLLTTQSRLGAEWIDIKNIGSVGYPLKNIQIHHLAYTNGKTEWKLLKDFNSSLLIPGLPSGIVMRIHSGSGPLSVLFPEDVQGASRHYFTGKNYVWNNDKIDRPMIYNSNSKDIIDQTYYDAFPEDGRILERYGDKLI